MVHYYKLKLDNCEYWQGEELPNGKKEYNKMVHKKNKNGLLNVIFLTKISNNRYMEMDTKIQIAFENGHSIFPKGINISLPDITPCSFFEMVEVYKSIEKSGKTPEYRKILKDLLYNSHYCQMCKEQKEKSLSLKRY